MIRKKFVHRGYTVQIQGPVYNHGDLRVNAIILNRPTHAKNPDCSFCEKKREVAVGGKIDGRKPVKEQDAEARKFVNEVRARAKQVIDDHIRHAH